MSALAVMFEHDVFEGDVYGSLSSGVQGPPPRAFVWGVFPDGQVEMSEFYDNTGTPLRFMVSVVELGAKFPLLERNPVPRIRYGRQIAARRAADVPRGEGA